MGSDTLPGTIWSLRDTYDDHKRREKLLYRLGIFPISRVTVRKLTHNKINELNSY